MKKKDLTGRDLVSISKISQIVYGDRFRFRIDRKCDPDLKAHTEKLIEFADEWLKELKRISPHIKE